MQAARQERSPVSRSQSPPGSRGDAVLVLPSGDTLPAHSVLLQLQSQPLADAIALGKDRESAGGKLRLPLAHTSKEEAEMLLKTLYSVQSETLLRDASLEDVRGLARVCHRFALQTLLGMVEQVRTPMLPCTCQPGQLWGCLHL